MTRIKRAPAMHDQQDPVGGTTGRRLRGWIRLLAIAAVCGGVGCRRPADRQDPAANSPTAPDAVASHNRGVAFMGQFDYDQACKVFAGLAESYPEWWDVQVDLAIALLNRRQTGDSERTAALLQTVQQQDPQNLRASYCQGIVAMDQGDPQTALENFRHVAQADPQDAYAVYFAGQCLAQLSQMEEALEHFERAIAIDPYLRSAYYAAFQTCLRLRRMEDANTYREQFSRLENNLQARLAEIKYTRMGPKAEVSVGPSVQAASARPAGGVFAEAALLPIREMGTENIAWAASSDALPSITVCDLNQDGRLDLFLAGGSQDADAPNLVLVGASDGIGWRWQPQHPLASVSQVNAAAWGDYDNDGLTDVYLGRDGANQLWRQVELGRWQNVTDTSQSSGGEVNTRDTAMFDADHDGDLDLFLVNDGPNELLSNNLDGTFRPLGQQQGLTGQGGPSRQIVAWDLDSDRDLDLLVVNAQPPHEVYRNDRLWSYEPAAGFDDLKQAQLTAAVAVDSDADGQWELATLVGNRLATWRPDANGVWQAHLEPPANRIGQLRPPLAACDVDGDGVPDLIASSERGWVVCDGQNRKPVCRAEQPVGTWRVANLDSATGPSLIACRPGQPPLIWSPGPGRFPFVAFDFSGKENRAEQMRSNRSGVGVTAAARFGGLWSAFQTLRSDNGPGQSLQPVAIGTRGAPRLDFVRMTWSDGLLQTERDLPIGERHRIEETQRQVSSCPVVFAWNGDRFEFVTDALGGGGLGFNLGRGQYSPARPWEHLLLPEGLLEPLADRWAIRIAEPMEEVCYLDAARLIAYDLPPGWDLVLDERFAVGEPAPTGHPQFFRHELLPVAAENDRGQDVLHSLRQADRCAAAPGDRDPRFIGRTQPHWVTLTFAEPLDQGRAYLVMDGWIEYPYSQTMFAAWQANAPYDAPTIQARDQSGQWHVVLEQFGYPAGMPRRAAVQLDRQRLPAGTTQLRLTTNLEIYWDRLAVVLAEEPPSVRRFPMQLRTARVQQPGFAHRQTHAQRRPEYTYQRHAPLWDTRHPKGFYTSFGPALPLVAKVDNAVAIIGPGEEVQLEFAAQQQTVEPGWRRRWVLELNGWCKDMDLFTKDGETVGPLPTRGPASDLPAVERDRLHEQYNQRYQAGF